MKELWEGKIITNRKSLCFEILRFEMNVVIPTFLAPAAYILFIIFMKISLRNDQSGRSPDWSTWIARAAAAVLIFLATVLVMMVDKSAEEV